MAEAQINEKLKLWNDKQFTKYQNIEQAYGNVQSKDSIQKY